MRKLFILGHSHMAALMAAHATARGVGTEFCAIILPSFQPDLHDGVLNPNIVARIEAAPTGVYVALIGGNEHCILCLINDQRRFDFVLPEAPDLYVDPAAELIPAGLLRAELQRRLAGHFALMAAYRAAAPGRMVQIESPPPIPSADFIEAHPDGFTPLIEARGVAPALFRYKMWRLHSALYREACVEMGIEFLPAPREMQDHQGMLAEAGWGNATHANEVYGKHVLAQLAA